MVSSISPLKIYEFYKTPKEIVKDTQNTVKQLRWIFWRKLLKNFKKLLPSFAKSSFLDVWLALRKKCPYSELFCSVFSRVRTEYGEILRNFPYSVRIRENPDQNNSEYGLCSCSVGSEYSSKSLERILFFFVITACPYSEFFQSVYFSALGVNTKRYSVYGHFSGNESCAPATGSCTNQGLCMV